MVAWDGSSLTSNTNTWAFRQLAGAALYQDYPAFAYTFVNSSVGGWATYPNLVKLQTTVLDYAPDLVIIDTANNDTGDGAHVEAYIRRVWAANPNTRIISWNFAAVADINVDAGINTPTNSAEITETAAVCAAYGIPVVDIWGRLKTLIAGGGHLVTYYADTAHLNAAGHAEAYTLLAAYLPNGGATKPAVYPARVYDTDGEYENTPTIILGTSYASRTGTGWVDTGTRTASSTPGDTITFGTIGAPITCKSIAVYRADAVGMNAQISVDGGAYQDFTLYQNGGPLTEGRGSHTLTFKVVDPIRIDEFWAI